MTAVAAIMIGMEAAQQLGIAGAQRLAVGIDGQVHHRHLPSVLLRQKLPVLPHLAVSPRLGDAFLEPRADGIERIGKIAAALEANGLPADTPAAMVRWGTMGRQQTITATLGTLAAKVAKANFKAPAVTIIGSVATLRDTLNWFENRPLFGQRVVVTRTRREAGKLSGQLRELGADVLEIPTIKIMPPSSNEPIIQAITGIGSYDWIIFTSANGVEHFFDYFFKAFRDVRSLGSVRFAAVGPATAKKLREHHLHIDLMPEVYTAAATAKALLDTQNIENISVLLARAEEISSDAERVTEAKLRKVTLPGGAGVIGLITLDNGETIVEGFDCGGQPAVRHATPPLPNAV